MDKELTRKQAAPLMLSTLLITVPATPLAAEPDDIIIYPDPAVANGQSVYLSPARHSDAGKRGECAALDGNENTTAFTSALHIANDADGLRAKGFEVRIGRGTLNTAIRRSNEWKADVHIPIHSNARAESCNSSNSSVHGAVIIYRSSKGQTLSNDILYYVEDITPGTNDFVCHESSPCTAYSSLAELRMTAAVAAYIEREFHTWNAGAKYLKNATDSAEIAYGIERYLNRDSSGRIKWWSIWSWWASWSWSRR